MNDTSVPDSDDPEIERNTDGTVTIHLTRPLRPQEKGEDPFAGTDKIVLSVPYAGDLVAMDMEDGKMGQTIALVASLSKKPKQLIKRLHVHDFGRISSEVERMMGKSL